MKQRNPRSKSVSPSRSNPTNQVRRTTMELKQETIVRTMVRGVYDQQKLRIQMGNRITANWKAKILAQEPSMSEKKLDKVSKGLLKKLRASFARITDGIVGLPRAKSFKGDELISEYTELVLLSQYERI